MNRIIILCVTLLLPTYVLGKESDKLTPETKEFYRVIKEYKKYLATISAETREEIVEFRKEISKLNQKKISLYKKLSQQSQNYLKREQLYKSKLPITLE